MHFIFGLKLLTHSFQVLFFQCDSALGASLCIGGAERCWPRGGSAGHDDSEKQPLHSGWAAHWLARSLNKWILISVEGLSTLTRWQIPH